MATPEGEYDKKHQVQGASGNGMRAEVWDKFKTRFNIPIIQEYYRSTEVHPKFYDFNDRELQDMIIFKKVTVFGDREELDIVALSGDSSKIQPIS